MSSLLFLEFIKKLTLISSYIQLREEGYEHINRLNSIIPTNTTKLSELSIIETTNKITITLTCLIKRRRLHLH